LHKNLGKLDEFENIKYQESDDSETEIDDEMPALVETDLSKIPGMPKGVTNMSKEDFLKIMMESYHSTRSGK
jgi:hypothetical protein